MKGIFFLSLTVLVFCCSSTAQVFTGGMTGQVTDQSGGTVTNAQLTATSLATNSVYHAQSNDQGVYKLLALPPGEYKLEVTAAGFRNYRQGPFTLQVAQVLTADVKLQVGDTTQEVVVTGAPPNLETETATVGQVITGHSIVNLPLNQRDPMALIGLTAGVVFGSNFGTGGSADVGRNFFKSDFNVGASRSGAQEILVDGGTNTGPDINRAGINPPVDSVQEFKVQDNSYSAEFGRSGGAIINIITKSGSNDVHGVAYDFERHSLLDANNFFNNRSGFPKTEFNRHQFGTNVGGKVIKNKIFYFGDYEGLRQAFPTTSLSTTATAAQRGGDFSSTFGSNGRVIQIFDPQSLATAADGTRTRNPFPGNIIPPNRVDPVSAKILTYMPLPNLPGNAITGQSNYIYAGKQTTNSDKFDLRGDFNFTDKAHMFARMSHQQDDRVAPGDYAPPAGGGRNTTDKYDQEIINLTYLFSPTLIGQVQGTILRELATQYGSSNGFNFASLGFASNFNAVAVPQFPGISMTDTLGTAHQAADAFTQYQPRNVFQYQGSLTWVHSSHTLKFGGEVRILDFNEGQNAVAAGSFTINRTYTQGPNPNQASANAGYSFASYLLGIASSGSQRLINHISTRGLYYMAFVQDDWKVNSRLTVNLGMRYDLPMGNREKYNQLAYFQPLAPSPLGPKAGLPNLTGTLGWIGQGNPTDQQDTDTNNFGPRVGAAYRIGDSTVLRAGYGIFYVPRVIQGLSNGAIEAFRDTQVVASIDGITPIFQLNNPFPQGFLFPANDRDPQANVGSQIQAPFRGNSDGYVQLYSAAVQHELKNHMVITGTYWGSKGTKLLTGPWNIDQLPNQYLSLKQSLNDQVPNPFFGLITAGALSGRNISRQQSLLPYPQYAASTLAAAVQQVQIPAGNTNFNAATIQVEKRATSGLTLLASYTWSKAIDDIGTPLDIYNRRLEKAISAFDTPHRLIASSVYELPWGKGRKMGTTWNPFVNAVLGNWDFDAIIDFQSGIPVAIARPGVNNGTSAKLSSPAVEKWFDTSVFTPAQAFTFGNLGPRLPDVRTDRAKNFDLSAQKNFPLTMFKESVVIQFRAEFFNAFNTPQFAAPNGSPTSALFGQVTSQANNPRDIQFALKVKF